MVKSSFALAHVNLCVRQAATERDTTVVLRYVLEEHADEISMSSIEMANVHPNQQ